VIRSRTRRRSTSSCVSPGHLQLALGRACALREDVEDECASVDDLARERLLQVALLRGRKRVVEDHDVAARRLEQVVDLRDLPSADERRR
jgi:hypothetical protein